MRLPQSSAIALALLALLPATATAAPTRAQAERAAKRAASADAQKFGIHYPPGMWNAACRRSGNRWRCRLDTGGQCGGRATVAGTRRKPRVTFVRTACGE
jgi:hypothetical protein